MRTIRALACLLAACTLSPGQAQTPGSASADLGEGSRYPEIKGSVLFTEGNDGIEISNQLRGLDPKKKYDLFLLPVGCPVIPPLDQAGIEKLKQARRTARKLRTINAGGGEANTTVKSLSLESVIAKGLLLSRGDEPVGCANVLPPFGLPPAPAGTK